MDSLRPLLYLSVWCGQMDWMNYWTFRLEVGSPRLYVSVFSFFFLDLDRRKRNRMEREGVKMIGVVGGGQMGSGIAQVAAMHGIDVCLLDVDPQALSSASSSISSSINRLVSKSHLSQVTISYSSTIYIYIYFFLLWCFTLVQGPFFIES